MRRLRACVLSLLLCTAIATAACSSDASEKEQPAGTPQPATSAKLVGTWILTGLQVAGEDRDVTGDDEATLTFSDGRRVTGDDLTNAMTGRYVVRGKTLTVSDTTSTLVGRPQSGPRSNCSDAFDVVFLKEKSSPSISLTRVRGQARLTVTNQDELATFTR